MLTVFAYPVSGVMKMWHEALTAVGVDPHHAWAASIVLLVVTVRASLLPFAWVQRRSAHQSARMRPEMASLMKQFSGKTDAESLALLQVRKRSLQHRYNVSMTAGCMPLFIQIPVLIGLYRLLMWMSRPEMLASHASRSGGFGFLTGEDIHNFLNSTLAGVPLPAYYAMSDKQLAALSTTQGDVGRVLLPLLLTAVVFTTANLCISNYVSFRTLNWNIALSRRLFFFFASYILIMPVMLLSLGVLGPLPIALVWYWATGNLWSTLQVITLNVIAHRRWPLTAEHREYHRANRLSYMEAKKQPRAFNRRAREWVDNAEARGSDRQQAEQQVEHRREEIRKRIDARREAIRAAKKELAESKAKLKEEKKQRRAAGGKHRAENN
ncbi:membrane protein insertase YidC [Corynebacterium uterequi]|nr:membrane protein insertase YidC [Corynebacterium uterequi]